MATYDPGSAAAMQRSVQNLRPLSIGELIDRAFSICFRHLLAFMALSLVVIAPQLIVSYLGAKGPLDMVWQQIGALQQASTGSAPVLDPTQLMQAYANATPYFLISFAIGLLFVPLSNAAVVSGISRAYLGMPVRFADCYRDAVPRWLSLILLGLLWLLAAGVTMIATSIAFAVFFGATAAAGASLGSAGVVVAIIFSILVGIAIIVVGLAIYLAAVFSFVAAVLEGLGADAAFGSGFRRVFGEGQFWRSLGIAASVVGISFGFWIVGAVLGSVVIATTHSLSFQLVVSSVINAFLYPFIFAVVAVGYYDVRIRREGYDLQMLASQLGANQPAAPSP